MKECKISTLMIGIFLGMLFGFFVLHPFVEIVNEFFHIHEGGQLHLHWNDIAVASEKAFSYSHWPNAVAYTVLSGTVGLLIGRIICVYRAIITANERFSRIGMNASSVIHDINSPLAGVVGYAEILENEIDNPDFKKYCMHIKESAFKIAGMVQDIKVIAQNPSMEVAVSKSEELLCPIVNKVALSMKLKTPFDCIDTLQIPVPVDESLFERVVWNLLKNAEDATLSQADALITVVLSKTDDRACIEIIDNGPGIPNTFRKRLFRLGQTYGKSGGSGIGLYTCKKIIEAHGGEILFMPRKPSGSVFKMYLPL